MRRFITTEVKRNAINRAWGKLIREAMRHPNEWNAGRIATLRAWIEDAVALADRGDDLPPFPKTGEDYDP